jgi:hypothetical protein
MDSSVDDGLYGEIGEPQSVVVKLLAAEYCPTDVDHIVVPEDAEADVKELGAFGVW